MVTEISTSRCLTMSGAPFSEDSSLPIPSLVFPMPQPIQNLDTRSLKALKFTQSFAGGGNIFVGLNKKRFN